MRNGLNTGNMSEFVHEIRTNPREALFRYSVGSTIGCDADVLAQVQTLAGGSLRIARPFEVRTGRGRGAQRDPRGERTCQEQLLVALGGCAMITALLGCAARAVSLSTLSMDIEAVSVPGEPLRDVSFTLQFGCGASSDILSSLARHVACFSPNHRTVLDRNEIQVSLRRETGARCLVVPQRATAYDRGVEEKVAGRLEWQYGTQIRARTRIGERARSEELWVDQPKQALGLDRAPNPQEYLLAALNADLLDGFVAIAAERKVAMRDCRMHSSGKLDLRGLLNVDTAVPVRMHELSTTLCVDSEAPQDEVLDMYNAASTSSLVHETICRNNSIRVRVEQQGRQIDEFISNGEFVREHLCSMEG
jgi:uncharacterized OsmC-like protein